MYGRWGNDEYIDYRGPSYYIDHDTRTKEEKEKQYQFFKKREEERLAIIARLNAGMGQYLRVGGMLLPIDISADDHMNLLHPYDSTGKRNPRLEVLLHIGQNKYITLYKSTDAAIDDPWTMDDEEHK